MTELLFYHLERRSLDDVLPDFVERTLARGLRALIRTESAERAQAIDNWLWTFNEESFLPHAQSGDGEAAAQPVLITVEEGNPNRAQVLFVVGGTTPAIFEKDITQFDRVAILFDGRDEGALAGARQAWLTAKSAGHNVTYWKQSTGGKWEKQT